MQGDFWYFCKFYCRSEAVQVGAYNNFSQFRGLTYEIGKSYNIINFKVGFKFAFASIGTFSLDLNLTAFSAYSSFEASLNAFIFLPIN